MIETAVGVHLRVLPDGPFLRSDAIRSGVAEKALGTLVLAGQLKRPFRGVLQPADCPDTVHTRAAAAGLIERWRDDRFVRQARRLIYLINPLAESFGESWLRLRLHDAGFPEPELQISLTDEFGVEVRRLDLGYRKKRYGLEYDGEAYHSGPEAEAADRRRRAEIERRWGWIAVGVGKEPRVGPVHDAGVRGR